MIWLNATIEELDSHTRISPIHEESQLTSSDSHLLGQESERDGNNAAHGLGMSVSSSSSVEASTAIIDTPKGICHKKNDSEVELMKSLSHDVFQPVVLEDETSPEMTSFFRRWGFAKYGAKKGCPRCKDLFNKGSSLQKHCSLPIHNWQAVFIFIR